MQDAINRVESRKFDSDKPRVSLIPSGSILGLARVFDYGAKKYGVDNWRGLEPMRLWDAAMRHMLAMGDGEIIDLESGIPHALLVASNMLMILSIQTVKPTGPEKPAIQRVLSEAE